VGLRQPEPLERKIDDMMEPGAVVALSTLVSIVSLVAVGLMFRSYQVDKFREKIFSLREELFLYSFDEGLVDDAVYRNFRELLNSLLRYAHKVTFPHMAVLLLTKRFLRISLDQEVEPMIEWRKAVKKLTTVQQDKFAYFDKKVTGLMIKHIVSRSVLFWVFAVCAVAPGLVRQKIAVSSRQIVLSFDIIKSAVRALVPVRLLEAEAIRITLIHS
jgi:hypothetical protein